MTQVREANLIKTPKEEEEKEGGGMKSKYLMLLKTDLTLLK